MFHFREFKLKEARNALEESLGLEKDSLVSIKSKIQAIAQKIIHTILSETDQKHVTIILNILFILK